VVGIWRVKMTRKRARAESPMIIIEDSGHAPFRTRPSECKDPWEDFDAEIAEGIRKGKFRVGPGGEVERVQA
jgi:hypothetical protein